MFARGSMIVQRVQLFAEDHTEGDVLEFNRWRTTVSGRARPSTSKWLTIDTRFRRFHKRSDAKEAPRRIWGTCPHRRRIACPLSRARPPSSLVHRSLLAICSSAMARNIIRSCWKASFLRYILLIGRTCFFLRAIWHRVRGGFLARDESKTARGMRRCVDAWWSVHAR